MNKAKRWLVKCPGIAEFFLPLEQEIRHHYIPCLVFHPPNDVERPLFALPAHLGGLGIFNPCVIAAETCQFSRHVAGPIVKCILNQHSSYFEWSAYIYHFFETSLEPSATHLLILLSLFTTNVHIIYNILLIFCWRGVLHPGSLLFPSNNTGLCYTREILLM